MSIGGYKSIKIPMDGNTLTDWGLVKTTSQKAADGHIRPDNVTIVLRHIVEALHTLDAGWDMKSGYGTTSDPLIQNASKDTRYINGYDTNMHFYEYRPYMYTIMKHSEGYELLLLYIYYHDDDAMAGINDLRFGPVWARDTFSYKPETPRIGGLCYSILPKESPNEFGGGTFADAATFLPEDATPIVYANAASIVYEYDRDTTISDTQAIYLVSKVDSETCILSLFTGPDRGYPKLISTGTLFENPTYPDNYLSKYGSIVWTTDTQNPWTESHGADKSYDCMYLNSITKLNKAGYDRRYTPRVAAYYEGRGWVSGMGKHNSSSPYDRYDCALQTSDARGLCSISRDDRVSAGPVSCAFYNYEDDTYTLLGWVRRDYCLTVPYRTSSSGSDYAPYTSQPKGCLFENGCYLFTGTLFCFGWDPSNYADQNPYYNPGA
ncbi:MAG: hypothetical protein MJZ34_03155 [Paludibacteraceae bacterium]|nr:hypothetical protein [Paludibacteraceae bacterium]